ncbi:MAG: c-type cytochrome biogenesis protein CcmI [Burkholderiales bacterium]
MIVFGTLGAALIALAVWALLRPFLAARGTSAVSRREANLAIHRDQRRELEADLTAGKLERSDYERSLAELESRTLEDADAPEAPARPPRARRATAFALIFAVPLAALAVYFAVGTPGALAPRPAGAEVTPAQIQAMVEGLAARLKQNPEDPEGWKMLGRSYAVLGRFGDATRAYAEAARRLPRDAQLLADLADALAMSRGANLRGEPEQLVRRALEIDPQNPKALALAGTAEFERQDFARAADTWARMLPLVAPDSEDARTIRGNVEEARRRAAGGVPAAAAGPALRGTIRLDPKLRARVQSGDTLFIYARAEKGPAMPLAILKRQAGELPLKYALDDSMAMAPGMELSSQPRVVITARVSRSGNARPQPGDLQGMSAPVAHDAQGVDIVIDTEVR